MKVVFYDNCKDTLIDEESGDVWFKKSVVKYFVMYGIGLGFAIGFLVGAVL